MAKQPGSDWGSITSFGGKVSSVFKGAGSGGARVRGNTNAVAGAAKVKDNYPSELTNALQKRSVKKVAPTETTRKTAPKKTVIPADAKAGGKKAFSPKKVVAKRSTLTAAQERGINWEKLNRLDRFN